MERGLALIGRILFAGMAAACAVVIAVAAFNWAMTERFGLHTQWREALLVSAVAFVLCTIGSAVLLALLTVLRKRWIVRSYQAAVIGGLIFWVAPSALTRSLGVGLISLPAGIVAGLLLSTPTQHRFGKLGSAALTTGLLAWLFLVAAPAIHALQENRLEQRSAGASLLGDRIMGGVVRGPDLWLFNQGGKLATIRLADHQPTVRASAGVAALAADGPRLWALLAPSFNWRLEHQPAARFQLAWLEVGHWHSFSQQSYAADERPLALAPIPGGAVVLGPKRLYILRVPSDPAVTRTLSNPIDPSGQYVMAAAGAHALYVGVNRGEFGGGLLRIDLTTGSVEAIDRRDDHRLCSGPLNGACDPVTGLVPDPVKPSCVFASIGLAHMMWSGRVVRVCGERVETVFERPILPIGERIRRALSSRAREFPPQTEPVFGITPAPGGFWAVTPRGLYRWSHGQVERHSFPKLEEAHGLALSTTVPGLAVVSTDANAAYSLSGFTPLVFAEPNYRDDAGSPSYR